MKNPLTFILSLCLSFTGCGQKTSKSVSFFQDTEAYGRPEKGVGSDTFAVEGNMKRIDTFYQNPKTGSTRIQTRRHIVTKPDGSVISNPTPVLGSGPKYIRIN